MAVKATFWVDNVEQNGGNPWVYDVRCKIMPHDSEYTGSGTCLVESVGGSATNIGLMADCKAAVIAELENNGVEVTPVTDSVKALFSFSLA